MKNVCVHDFVFSEEDLSLIGNMSIPSHEEVENDSMNALLDFENDLLPTSSLAIEQWLAHFKLFSLDNPNFPALTMNQVILK